MFTKSLHLHEATGAGEMAISLCGWSAIGLTGVVAAADPLVDFTGVTWTLDVIAGVQVAVVLTVLHTECSVLTGGATWHVAADVGTEETGAAALPCVLLPGTVSTSFIPMHAFGP